MQDLPKAEMHRLEAGHFAVEDCLDYISENMHRFYRDSVAPKPSANTMNWGNGIVLTATNCGSSTTKD